MKLDASWVLGISTEFDPKRLYSTDWNYSEENFDLAYG